MVITCELDIVIMNMIVSYTSVVSSEILGLVPILDAGHLIE